jgi:group I intron endonuclease
MSIGIYKITNPKGKIYIGQSTNIEKRWKYYSSQYHNKKDKQTKLFNSLIKYSPKNHKFEILEECTVEQLNEREIYWGHYYNCTDKECGLNLRELGKQGQWTDEAKLKLSLSQKGKLRHTDESKAKISTKLKGTKYTDEQKKKCSENSGMKGKSNPNGGSKKGWLRTEESKERIKNSKTGIKHGYFPHYNKRKKINQYDLLGNYIKTWDSVNKIKEVYPNLNNNVFTGKQKYSHGFIFIYYDSSSIEEIERRKKLIKRSTLIKYGFI